MVEVALVGCGNWGKNYLRNLSQISGFKLSLVCDTKEDVGKNVDKNISFTTRFNDVVDNPSIKAIVIATTPLEHYLMVKEALMKGKDVLVEKPITLSKKEALELFSIAKEKQQILMTGHIMEYHPVVQRLKEYIKDKLLGDIYYMYLIRTNLGLVRPDVNVMWDLGVHDLSVVRFLVEERPEFVTAQGATYLQQDIEDVVFITLKYKSGLMVKIHVSWLDPNKTRLITLVGDQKMITFDDMENSEKVRIYNRGVSYKEYSHEVEYPFNYRYGDITIPNIKMFEPLKEQCEHFLDCITNRKEPLTGLEDSLWVMEIMDKAQKSLKNNGKMYKLEWSEINELLNQC